ncbi:hypothetical protein M431DRAFT_381818 [Trichoderma harzianum CBS 226.95]|uniref:Uncharacterized protein n=1 Tax=Trichoderma harzianum CBS 226.95 TaxID=983964 RepID=A0A2T4AI55_TRIHA|nr:hypothetical protein M431DRAFT_381818 [Trichoderma harzianum CBS 226.95]PTB56578.1 hypothetical protein M431DRAFT_381818 [Trichoderma harzianum CBS 226.95]
MCALHHWQQLRAASSWALELPWPDLRVRVLVLAPAGRGSDDDLCALEAIGAVQGFPSAITRSCLLRCRAARRDDKYMYICWPTSTGGLLAVTRLTAWMNGEFPSNRT